MDRGENRCLGSTIYIWEVRKRRQPYLVEKPLAGEMIFSINISGF
jgi:hypothetical protein